MCNSTDDRGGSFSFPCGYWQSFYRLDMDVQGACANLTCAHAEGGGGLGGGGTRGAGSASGAFAVQCRVAGERWGPEG